MYDYRESGMGKVTLQRKVGVVSAPASFSLVFGDELTATTYIVQSRNKLYNKTKPAVAKLLHQQLTLDKGRGDNLPNITVAVEGVFVEKGPGQKYPTADIRAFQVLGKGDINATVINTPDGPQYTEPELQEMTKGPDPAVPPVQPGTSTSVTMAGPAPVVQASAVPVLGAALGYAMLGGPLGAALGAAAGYLLSKRT